MGISKEEKKLLEIQAGQAYRHHEQTKKSDKAFRNFGNLFDAIIRDIFK